MEIFKLDKTILCFEVGTTLISIKQHLYTYMHTVICKYGREKSVNFISTQQHCWIEYIIWNIYMTVYMYV